MASSDPYAHRDPLWHTAFRVLRPMLAMALVALGLALPAPAASADEAPVAGNYVLPDAYLGVSYSAQLTAIGGTAPYSWNFVGGVGCDALPAGLTLSESGRVAGTPSFAVGHCTMNVSLVDSSPSGDTYHPVTVTITIQAVAPPCTAAAFVAAVDGAADGSVVTVCDDLDLGAHAMTVPAGHAVTIDLAGHALTANGAAGGPALTIPTGASVTVVDTAAGGPGPAGSATFGDIADDGTLTIDRGAAVTEVGTISGVGTVDGEGTLQNNGSIRHTVTVVPGLTVHGHSYLLLVYPNDGAGGLEDMMVYAATLGNAGIDITPMRDRLGYTFTGWFPTAAATGTPVTTTTDLTTGAWYRILYSGWLKGDAGTWYADSTTGNDANTCLAPGAACKTIAAALEKAADGDIVNVAAGDYGSAHGGMDLTITKSVTLHGASAGTVTVTQADDAVAPAIAAGGGANVTVSGMMLVGAGSADAVVDASGVGTGLALANVDVTDSGTDAVPLDGLSVHDGAHADVTGGTIHDLPFGIRVADAGTLTLDGTTVRDNGNSGIVFATDAGDGSSVDAATISGNGVTRRGGAAEAVGNTAGITVDGGTLRLSDSTLAGNGSGLSAGPAVVTITGGAVLDNLAGGIGVAAPHASVSVDAATVTGNNRGADAAGASGISMMLGGSATVTNSVISGNGVGISNLGGSVAVAGSVVSDNLNSTDRTPMGGGGIVTAAMPTGTGSFPTATSVTSSTIADNQSGILATGGTTSVTSSTIAHNMFFGAVADAHGITAAAPSDPVRLSLVRSTVADNGRVGVAFDSVPLAGVGAGDDATVTLAGTVITKGAAVPACAVDGSDADPATIIDAGYTLADDASCPLTGTGSLTEADPVLGVMADNGSAVTPVTKTMLPGAGSPALDRIPVGVMTPVFGVGLPLCEAHSTDERGAVRPAPSAAKCDIGAAERDESADAADPADPSGPSGPSGLSGPAGPSDPVDSNGTPAADDGAISVLGAGAARLAGPDRYATEARIAAQYVAQHGGTDAVIVANGTDAKQGMDALAANYLAGRMQAPILLTAATAIAPETVSAAKAVLAGSANATIYVMGGTDSVSDTVAAHLVAAARTVAGGTVRVVRIAGADRYATAAKAAAEAGAVTNSVAFGDSSKPGITAILASGVTNADVLAAGPLAYAWGLPVLLTGPSALPGASRAAIRALHISHLIVLGGPDRVSPAVLDAAKKAGAASVIRVAGTDRFDTAARLYGLVMDTVTDDGDHYGTDGAAAYLANGVTGFADALAAGPVVGAAGSPLLTVPANRLPPSTAAFLTAHAATLPRIVGLGRAASIADAVLAAAVRLG